MSNATTSLNRPLEGRWLAGVATGLGKRFGAPVWIIRIVILLLCFAGGVGALLYVAGWLLIPKEGETEAIIQTWLGADQSRRWWGVILVGVAVVILASRTGLIRVDLAFAVVLIGLGVMLYRGDLDQRSDGGDDAPSKTGIDEASTPTPPPAVEGVDEGKEEAVPSTESLPDTEAVDPPIPPPAKEKETSYLGRVTLGGGVLALGVLGLLDAVVPGFHPLPRHYLALLVAVIGIGLVIGAWFGRTGGLAVLGVLVIPFLLLSPLADLVDGDSSIGRGSFETVHSYHRITSVEYIRSEYELVIGTLEIDLREVDFAGRTVETEMEVGIGEVLVYLPEDVSAVVYGEVGIGSLSVNDRTRGGFGVHSRHTLAGHDGELRIRANAGIGQIRVVTRSMDGRQYFDTDAYRPGAEGTSHLSDSGWRRSDSYSNHSIHDRHSIHHTFAPSNRRTSGSGRGM